jgi:integrase
MASIRARADSGKLFFDFRFQGTRCREQTLLDDTPANRRRLEKVLQRIELEIHQGFSTTRPSSLAASLPQLLRSREVR